MVKKLILFLENSFLAFYQNPLRSVLRCNNWKRLLRKCNFTAYEFGFHLFVSYLVLFWGWVVIFPEWLQNCASLNIEKSCRKVSIFGFWHVCVCILLTSVDPIIRDGWRNFKLLVLFAAIRRTPETPKQATKL